MIEKALDLVLLTLIPWIELRGSIPYGISHGLDPFTTFFLCVAVNIAIIPLIFLFLKHIFPFFEHWKISQHVLKRTRKKSKKYVKKYGYLGLTLFVAVPLPGSGVYSGSIATYVFDIPRKKALSAIATGTAIAGVIVTLGSIGIFSVIL